MKNIFFTLALFILITCTGSKMDHIDTAQIVVESFYQKDLTELKELTTPESYEAFISVQDLIAPGDPKTSNFKVVEEMVDGDVAWVKFTTSYEEKPETFKLVKKDGKWKVTETGLREKGPF